MDPEEIAWARQNIDAVLQNDFSLSVNGGGGLRIDAVRSGSIGSARGIKEGDVIRSVNGIALNDLKDLQALRESPQMKSSKTLSLDLERSGRRIQVQYIATKTLR
jgi:S1-C subfamily serine protease